MLTPRQKKLRQRTLGASEIGAIADLVRWKTPLDVYATKRRGPRLELPPIIAEPDPDPDTCDAFAPSVDTDRRTVGQILEHGIVKLYEHRTGARCTRSTTLRHPEKRWASCTPDRFVRLPGDEEPSRGCEVKLVGENLKYDWPLDDGVPEYVTVQCQWSMGITGLEVWDVPALIGGTDFRIRRVFRDQQLIDDLFELAASWWQQFVLGNETPPARDGADAMRLLSRRFPEDNGELIETDPATDVGRGVQAMAQRLLRAQHDERKAKAEVDRLKSLFCALIGEHRGIGGSFGRFEWRKKRGAPVYKAIAEELAGGAIPQELIDRHRAEGHREARFYPHKMWKAYAIKALGLDEDNELEGEAGDPELAEKGAGP